MSRDPNLVELMAYLVDTISEAKHFATQAELSTIQVDLSGSAVSMWANLLREAHKQTKLDSLSRIVAAWFPARKEELALAGRRYKQVMDRVAGVAPHLTGACFKSRRPTESIRTDYRSTRFVDPLAPGTAPEPIADVFFAHKTLPKISAACVVADHSADVTLSLQEVEEALMLTEAGAIPPLEAVWIQSERLANSSRLVPVAGQRADHAAVREVCLGPEWGDDIEAGFERALEEKNCVFILDFSRLPYPLLTESAKTAERRQALIDVTQAFFDDVTGRGQKVVLGLPRRALISPGWRDIVRQPKRTFIAAPLFDFPAENLAHGEPPAAGTVFHEVLLPLLNSNSPALSWFLQTEIDRLNCDPALQSADSESQLTEVIAIAMRLVDQGLLEPAYRLEVWYRFRKWGGSVPPLKADLKSVLSAHSSDRNQGASASVYGLLEDVVELPKVNDRVLLTGESGMGKTAVLKKIEGHWSLPRPSTGGKSTSAWLPFFLHSIDRPQIDLAEHLGPIALGEVQLAAHTALAEIGDANTLPWLFGSRLLLLMDRPPARHPGRDVENWWRGMMQHRSKPGFILACRERSEAPFGEKWFDVAFSSFSEARLRPLNRDEACSLCSTAASNEVAGLFARPGEPLGYHIGNPFVLGCIDAVSKAGPFNAEMSLFELMAAYVGHLCAHGGAAALQTVNVRLPELAYARLDSDDVYIEEDVATDGILLGFLDARAPHRFRHGLLADYFLASHLGRHWVGLRQSFFNRLGRIDDQACEILYLNLVRMLMASLAPAHREELAAFLNGLGRGMFAHRCLLELSKNEYVESLVARRVRESLLETLAQNTAHGHSVSSRDYRSMWRIADSLGRYDARIEISDRPDQTFIVLSQQHGSELSIARYPVTNREFAQFVADDGYATRSHWAACPPEWRPNFDGYKSPAPWNSLDGGHPNHPVVGISFYEALAYCHWLTQRDGRPGVAYAMMTREVWSLATGAYALVNPTPVMSISGSGDLRGEIMSLLRRQRRPLDHNRTAPVGIFQPTTTGVHDCFGNVWQWCDEWFVDGLQNLPSEAHLTTILPVLVVGGPAISEARGVTSLMGGGLDPSSRADNLGFRLIRRVATQHAA